MAAQRLAVREMMIIRTRAERSACDADQHRQPSRPPLNHHWLLLPSVEPHPDSTPSSKLLIKLDFIKSFEGHNIAEYSLEPAGDSTKQTWAMYGPAPFISKLMGVFVSLDSMIGKDFESGLANLKAAAEK